MGSTTFRRRILRFIATLLVGYVIALVVIRIFESRLLFFPNFPNRLAGDWKPANLPVQDVWLMSDGVKLHAWWIPAENAKFTFLAFHGNAGNIALRSDIYRFLHDTPANVLAVEYRGYGRSDGSPSERGLYRDADAGFQYLVREKAIAPKTIVSFGQSLGTAVATNLAANAPVGALVLEAPFPSATAVARRTFWFLPGVGLMVAGQLNTREKLGHVNAPVLVIHCTQDPVIPPDLAEQVYESARPPKSILRVSGYCHEEASIIAPATYRTALQSFLAGLQKNGTASIR
jgi:uncharacterized protein